MKKLLTIALGLFVILCISSCGGGGGGTSVTPITPPTGITIQGTALVPSGSGLAAKEAGRTANAATGLVSVTSGTAVSVYYIDDSGTLSGSAIATSTVTGGSFSLTLPTSITAITSSMVVVMGSGTNQMRSFVTSTTALVVSPLSEYVVTQVAANTATLSSFSVQEITTIYTECYTTVNSQNFTFSSYTSVSTAVTAIGANVTISTAVSSQINIAVNSNLSVTATMSPTTGITSDAFTLTCTVSGGTATTLEGRCDDSDSWATISSGITRTCSYSTAGTYTPGCRVDSIATDDVDSAITVSTVAPSTLCTTAAIGYVTTAKNNIFQPEITSTEFSAAQTAITSALADSPNCPDANFLGAIIDIIAEGDRIGRSVLTNPQSIFPYELQYEVSNTLGRVAGAITQPILGGLPRTAATLDSSSNASDYQAEMEANTLGVLTGALTKLNTARTGIAATTSWSFSYPKDPAYPSLGNEYIDGNDVDLITGALQITLGSVYYALSFNFDVPANYESSDPCPVVKVTGYVFTPPFTYTPTYATDTSYSALSSTNRCTDADVNNNDILTPLEYVLPSPYGTVKTTNYLALSKTSFVNGIGLIKIAIDNILLDSEKDLAGMIFTTELIADVQHYKSYLADIEASFNGTPTSLTLPGNADCWKSGVGYSGTYYYNESVYDPNYNTDQLANCLLTFTTKADVTATVNLSKLFELTDLRQLLPDYSIDISGHLHYATTFIGNTMGGIFPNGVQSDWGDVYLFTLPYFYSLTNSTTGNMIDPLPSTGITFSISGNDYQPTSAANNYAWNYIDFRKNVSTTLISQNDYFLSNDIFGVNATLSIPNYQDYNFIFYNFDWSALFHGISLTP